LTVTLSLDGIKGYYLRAVCQISGVDNNELWETNLALGADNMSMLIEAEELFKNAQK